MGGITGETARPMAPTGARPVVGDVLDHRGRQTAPAITAAGEQPDTAHMSGTDLIVDGSATAM
jgi:hypothetical protein